MSYIYATYARKSVIQKTVIVCFLNLEDSIFQVIDVGVMKVTISGEQKVVKSAWHGMRYVLTSYSSASSTWTLFLYCREQNMMYVCSIGWLLVVHHSMVSVHTSQMWIKSPNLVLQYKEPHLLHQLRKNMHEFVTHTPHAHEFQLAWISYTSLVLLQIY